MYLCICESQIKKNNKNKWQLFYNLILRKDITINWYMYQYYTKLKNNTERIWKESPLQTFEHRT